MPPSTNDGSASSSSLSILSSQCSCDERVLSSARGDTGDVPGGTSFARLWSASFSSDCLALRCSEDCFLTF